MDEKEFSEHQIEEVKVELLEEVEEKVEIPVLQDLLAHTTLIEQE